MGKKNKSFGKEKQARVKLYKFIQSAVFMGFELGFAIGGQTRDWVKAKKLFKKQDKGSLDRVIKRVDEHE